MKTTPGNAAPGGLAVESGIETSSKAEARVALLGATGYSGWEFARLAASHAGLKVAVRVTRQAGAGDSSPRYSPHAVAPTCEPGEVASWFERGEADTLVSCLPHGALRALTVEHPELGSLPRRVVDLSSDHRDGREGYVYGLPEMNREKIGSATRIANPGCYATAFALALLPAAETGVIGETVAVSALSGVSGAGRSASLTTSFVEVDSGASIYKAGTEHPHLPEMERTLSSLGNPAAVGFVPQLVPMSRGILLTATTTLRRPLSPDEARSLYASRFANEKWAHLLPSGAWPNTHSVRGTNYCHVAVTTLHQGRTLLATAALDNLVKGAAGQAIQNLNLMLGWPEDTGLPMYGMPS